MFGFPEMRVRKALKNTDNNPERAADWLFSHMDDPDSDGGDHEMSEPAAAEGGASQYSCEKPGMYDLTSFITHLGASIHAGHYVCHVR
jgi:ubiquitin carboxyl-terminal hydrolase 5/13